jgi:hypothetical protein
MKEADHYLFGQGPKPVQWDRLIADAEKSGEILFKAI